MSIDQAMETHLGGAPHGLPLEEGIPTPEMWCVIRRRLGWSLDFAAQQIGISSVHLDHLESGIRTPNTELVGAIADAYGVEVDRLEARARLERIPPQYDAETGTLWLGWLPIECNSFGNAELLAAIGATLRTMRSLTDQHPVYLRAADLAVIAPLFDLDDAQLGDELVALLRLSESEAADVLETLLELAG